MTCASRILFSISNIVWRLVARSLAITPSRRNSSKVARPAAIAVGYPAKVLQKLGVRLDEGSLDRFHDDTGEPFRVGPNPRFDRGKIVEGQDESVLQDVLRSPKRP